MDKILEKQKEFIESFTKKSSSENPLVNMDLIKSEMSSITREKDKSFMSSITHKRAERLYKSIIEEIEVLSKAREGLVKKTITVQGKNGSYQKTVWVRSGEAKGTEKKGKEKEQREDKAKKTLSVKDKQKALKKKLNELTGLDFDFDANQNLRSDKDSNGKDYEIELNDDGKFEVLYNNVSIGKPSDNIKDVLKNIKDNADKVKDSDGRDLDSLNENQRDVYDYFKKDLEESWSDIFDHGTGGGFPGITYTQDNLNHLKNKRPMFRGMLKDAMREGLFGDEDDPKFSLFGDKFDEEQTEQVMDYMNYGNLPEDPSVIDFIVWYAVEDTAHSMYPNR